MCLQTDVCILVIYINKLQLHCIIALGSHSHRIVSFVKILVLCGDQGCH